MEGRRLIHLFENLAQEFGNAGQDLDKFVNRGNKSARIRFRKRMLNIRNLAQDCRVESMNLQKDRDDKRSTL